MEKSAPKIAAIDVGTNSIHLIIASVDHRGLMTAHYKDKDAVRLGSGFKDMKHLSDEAIERGIAALKRFAEKAREYNAEIYAVATSAVREAENKETFLRRAKEEAGVSIEAISGIEEGRLIYLGASRALPISERQALVLDIGGGSVETIIGAKGEVLYAHSEKLGAIRCSNRFFPDGISSETKAKECREFIKGVWSPTMRQLLETGFETAIGTSGTIINLAYMALAARGDALPEEINGTPIQRAELLNVIDRVVSAKTPEERLKIKGLDPKRADIILGGALILERAIIALNIQTLIISSYALREGLVYEAFRKNVERLERRQLGHLRYKSVRKALERYGANAKHAEFVRNVSLKIFDALQAITKLGFIEREWLEAAALLHDVGFYISREQHHKHSYYLISHCDLPGFTKDEQEIIANAARYHRKSHPKPKHEPFQRLPQDKKRVVKILAGVLRIAEGVDRRQIQAVKDVEIYVNQSRVKITLIPRDNEADISVELWGAERRKQLLEETLGLEIDFEVAES